MTAVVWCLLTFATSTSAIQSPKVLFEAGSIDNTSWWPLPFPNPFASSDPDATRVQRLENDADVAYYGELWVGGQTIKAIVDTGSFELLVFGKNCSVCGGSHLYDQTKSRAANVTGVETSHSYGSGTCYSVEAFDKLALAGFKVPAQQFWEVVDAEMDLLAAGSFQAIFGVGPPSSAVNEAEQESEEVHEELKKLERRGGEITPEIEEIVQHYDDMADLMKKTTGVIQHLQIENLSFCFGKTSGSEGYAFWNDHAARDEPEKFLTLDVVGDYYWSAELGAVRLANGTAPEGASEEMEHVLAGSLDIGCSKGNCSAVIDTGTSLIAAPSDTVQAVYELADAWEAAGGTCDDLSKLPELRFTLNGHDFVLPPESYMGVVEGSASDYSDLKKYMPRLHERQEKRRREFANMKNKDMLGEEQGQELGVSSCEPLVMTMDADSQFGQLWILGMPFFRTYYSSFRFKHHDAGSPTGASMSFSVADDQCRPGVAPNANSADRKEQLDTQGQQGSEDVQRAPRAETRPATMRVHAGKIRVPPFAERHGRLATRAQRRRAASKNGGDRELDTVPFHRI